MAPVEIHDDYYAVLEITPTASDDEIKASYKRLAKVRHPDKNAGNPQATADFQLLQAAYSTLIDPSQRRDYDFRHYPKIRARQPPKQPPRTSTGTDPNPHAGSSPSKPSHYKVLIASLDRLIAEIQSKKARYEILRMDTARSLASCRAKLINIQREEEKDAAEEAARKDQAASFLTPETSEEKEARQRRATERRMGRIVREAEEKRLKTKVEEMLSRIREYERRISSARILKETAMVNLASEEEKARAGEARKWRQEKEEEERLKREAEMKQRWKEEMRKQQMRQEEQQAEAKRRQEEVKKKAEEIRKRNEEARKREEAAAEKLRKQER
ncbi:hypothetical protein OQA88_3099 [Cercophora sp. LCS_1]